MSRYQEIHNEPVQQGLCLWTGDAYPIITITIVVILTIHIIILLAFSEVQVAPSACLRSKQRLRGNLHGLVPLPLLLCLQVHHHHHHGDWQWWWIWWWVMKIFYWFCVQWLQFMLLLFRDYQYQYQFILRCNKNPFLKQGWNRNQWAKWKLREFFAESCKT